MINLAGEPNADRAIENELTRARIPISKVEPDTKHSEVPYSLVGELGGFSFTRAWTYWVVKGRMPLDRAKKLYEDPEGKESVRVAGHCGCPPPEDPWISYVAMFEDKERKVLHGQLNLEDLAKWRAEAAAGGQSWFATEWLEKVKAEYIVSVDPLAVQGVFAFIDTYHIDTQAGLRLFADEIHDILKGIK